MEARVGAECGKLEGASVIGAHNAKAHQDAMASRMEGRGQSARLAKVLWKNRLDRKQILIRAKYQGIWLAGLLVIRLRPSLKGGLIRRVLAG
jgi:hypothetical protein